MGRESEGGERDAEYLVISLEEAAAAGLLPTITVHLVNPEMEKQ